MKIKLPLDSNINVEDIYVVLRCPECGHTFNIKLLGPMTTKNCRVCQHATFIIQLTAGKKFGVLVAVAMWLDRNGANRGFLGLTGYSFGETGPTILA